MGLNRRDRIEAAVEAALKELPRKHAEEKLARVHAPDPIWS